MAGTVSARFNRGRGEKKVIENTGNAFGSGQDKSAQKCLKDTLSLRYVSSCYGISVLLYPKKGRRRRMVSTGQEGIHLHACLCTRAQASLVPQGKYGEDNED